MRLLYGRMLLLAVVVPTLAARADEPTPAVARAQQEILRGLEQREIGPRLDMYRAYAGELLDASAGTNSFRDKTGNCRLSWVDHMLRNPVKSLAEADLFTRHLHDALNRPAPRLDLLLHAAAAKLDVEPPPARPAMADDTPVTDILSNCVRAARSAVTAALSPLSADEQQELRTRLLAMAAEKDPPGHRFADKENGRRMCDLLEEVDLGGFLVAADRLLALADPSVMSHLVAAELPPGRTVTDAGVILVGGHGDDRYDLDAMQDVALILEPGGNDTYLEGTVSAERPVLAVVDLEGNDVYQGTQPGIQGSAVLGVSVVIDANGDDTYEAADVAQGTCLGGAGALIDLAGSDRYSGVKRVQGYAIGGPAILLDCAGDDDYHAAMLAQGVGGPLGFGLIEDLRGTDHYYAGGKFPGGYDDSPGYGSWSQGVGIGPRGIANGGIGVLLDGEGDDTYEGDYFAHGGGYWFAAGFARDFEGNDIRYGASLKAFDGSERDQKRFLRWGLGYGCHYALGFLFDDGGDDLYDGTTACLGFAWDIAVGVVIDAAGNDRYEARGSAEGQGCNAALGVLYDGAGDDIYTGKAQGLARDAVDYHPKEKAGGNFSFLIDLGGKDEYGAGLTNNTVHERGWAGGFVIDRAKPVD